MTKDSRHITRQIYKRIRQTIPLNYQTQASKEICNRILSLAEFKKARNIALYHAINGEVDLHSLWVTAQKNHQTCYFPSLNAGNTLSFLKNTPETPNKKNKFGILEPIAEKAPGIHPSEIDIILMPLVAFDKMGTRLGMGAGYYDRTFADNKPRLLAGVAYDFQRVSRIEPQPWDVPLSLIITEKTTYWSKP